MNIKELSESTKKSITMIESKHRKRMEKLFHEFIEKVFEAVPDLNFFSILGMTPYFNDGEPCEHSTYALDYESDLGEHGAVENEESEEGEWIWTTPNGSSMVVNPGVPWEDICVASRGVYPFAQTLNSVYGTNWQLVFYRDEESGKVLEHYEEKEPNY